MTREEAIDEVIGDTAGLMTTIEVEELVNKIYNDFESRTCENCKWFNKSICFSPNGYMGGSMTDKDFGCNKFEPKDNK